MTPLFVRAAVAVLLLVLAADLASSQTRPKASRGSRTAKSKTAATVSSAKDTVVAAKVARIVAVEQAQQLGIDRDKLDATYIDGSGVGCTDCRFSEAQREAYDASWNTFLSDLMNMMLRHDVGFSELVLRAYFAKDGTLDYLLYHVGGSADNNANFVKAAEHVARTFTFDPAPSGPFKQSATISLGAPVEAE